jgi:hypothetical protein
MFVKCISGSTSEDMKEEERRWFKGRYNDLLHSEEMEAKGQY